jgi:hypothetical protein
MYLLLAVVRGSVQVMFNFVDSSKALKTMVIIKPRGF